MYDFNSGALSICVLSSLCWLLVRGFFLFCFYTLVTIVRGHYGLPLSVRPYVCLSIPHTLWYRVCVINFSYSCQWIFLKPCILIVDIMKMCMWIFDGARINFHRVTAFRTWSFYAIFSIVGYEVCVINSSYSFQWIVLKLCILVVDITKMCMWIIDGARLNFDRIMAF